MLANDPSLRNANKVYVKQCTSDAHMGNGEAFGWQFRGQVVVQAVLNDLVSSQGLGSTGTDLLLFGGGSAGARGAWVHLEYVPQMLGEASKSVKVLGFLDSGLWVDYPPYRDTISLMNETRLVHGFANAEHLGKCGRTYSGDEAWKCLFGEYRLPLIPTPYLLTSAQYDAYQLKHNVGSKLLATDAGKAYAEGFAAKQVEVLNAIYDANPEHAVFSWACFNHDVSPTHDGFDNLTCNGVTMEEALLQFTELAELTSVENRWIEQCSGYACGTGCEAPMAALFF